MMSSRGRAESMYCVRLMGINKAEIKQGQIAAWECKRGMRSFLFKAH